MLPVKEHNNLKISLADEGRFFTRVVVKPFSPIPDQRVLVAELDGVRCYFDGDTVIITKEDLNAFPNS